LAFGGCYQAQQVGQRDAPPVGGFEVLVFIKVRWLRFAFVSGAPLTSTLGVHKEENKLIIDCPNCESKVDGILKGEVVENAPDDFPHKCVLVQCPVCGWGLLGISEFDPSEYDNEQWSNLYRVWPKQESHVDREIPDIARNSLVEAKLCFKAKAFSACAVMCGRAIEGICVHYQTKNKSLAKGLEELREKRLIDDKLFEWGEALRMHRNIGAHATATKISKDDARDLLDFTQAICEYIFVLTEKFNKFKERAAK